MSVSRLGLMAAIVFVMPATAQPPDAVENLIVLLGPEEEGAPAPEAVVEAINLSQGDPGDANVPGGLAEGNPLRARLTIERRATGRLLQLIKDDLYHPEALLMRYVTITYPSQVVAALLTALPRNPHVRHVQRISVGRLHTSRARPTKDIFPFDPFVGTFLSLPTEAQWWLHVLGFPEAWEWTKGTGYAALLDTGSHTQHEDLVSIWTDPGGTAPPTLGPFREKISRDLIGGISCNVDEILRPEGEPTFVGHGAHVSGLIAGNGRNGIGGAGGCLGCSLQVVRVASEDDVLEDTAARGLLEATKRGYQVANMSFGFRKRFTNDPEPPCANSDLRFLCTQMNVAVLRDMVIVASAGNDLAALDFPANSWQTIAVGGLEHAGWTTPIPEIVTARWVVENCPNSTGRECGSNFGPELDLMTPAAEILSTMFAGKDWSPGYGCGDSIFPTAGYGLCTGTSMSAGELTALIALVRSVNPLLNRDAIYHILVSTASRANHRTDEEGFGIPNALAAVLAVLGRSGTEQIVNRLTPLFSFFGAAANQDPNTNPDFRKAETHAYTTVPSIASSWLLEDGDPLHTIGNVVRGYPLFPEFSPCQAGPPCEETLPKADLFVFTTDRAPYDGTAKLVPLHRMNYDPDILADCDPIVDPVSDRDFTYTTTAEGVEAFTSLGADYAGIEGYIFESCEVSEDPNCTQPTGTVKVYRMFHPERRDYAIFPESQLSAMIQDGYIEQDYFRTVIGYAYENVDSDSDMLIDGFEMLIGTDPTRADSDCDGMSDGEEILVYDPARGGYGNPLLGPCAPIFVDGFETGDASRWSSTTL